MAKPTTATAQRIGEVLEHHPNASLIIALAANAMILAGLIATGYLLLPR